jgi:outer membrane protein assembly factor BamB
MSYTLTPPAHAKQIALPLRLWPAVLIVAAEWLLITVPGWIIPGTMTQFMLMMYAPIAASVGLVIWWLSASRLDWSDRLLGAFVFLAGGAAALALCHDSFRFPLIFYGLPAVTAAWVGWLLLSAWMPWPVRRVGLVLAILLAWGGCALFRFDGITGGMDAQLSFRWSPTAEARYLAYLAGAKTGDSVVPASEPITLTAGDWPGFRGPARDGRLTGVRIAAGWDREPPRKLWKRPIGPGWSSFAVVGKRAYTQEQRGDDEAVVCLDAETGEQAWAYTDATRFTEQVSGAGPRATPTFHEGRLYALGANGALNCLDAATGKKIWGRDVARDSGAKVPQWGFSSSPLVAGGLVSVFAGGPGGKAVLAYKAESGEPAWSAGEGTHSYCSTQLSRIAGVEQLLVTSDQGLTAFDPATGKVLWDHRWVGREGLARCTQPAVLDDGDVLLGTGFGVGTRRLHLRKKADGWSDEEVWTTKALNPYYNDLVVHRGHLYGFDGIFFTCVRLDDGEKCWRVRGYGNGQVLLLAEQGLLLVLSEKGEVVLLKADPEKHAVVGRFQAIQGKTWNHPVVAQGKLFVRNGEEVACFRLAPEEQ